LIEQVISLQAADVRDKGVAIDCELNPDLPVAQIQQVLFNLLVDATDAIYRFEEPKKLTLRTDFTNDHVSLEVETAVVVSQVWSISSTQSSRMYHEEQSWPLAISRSIITAKGGTLEATRREGGVTNVRIELPRFNSLKQQLHD
jgi:C4-dicarboxylate-specific signal transduction histidine kinase